MIYSQLVGLALLAAIVLSTLWVLFLRCLHDWEPVVERELPSKAEVLKANGENIASWRYTRDLEAIAQKTFFAIISCKKCGAVKQFVIKT